MTPYQCHNCIHYVGNFKCEAFPDRIPLEIFTGQKSHREHIKGDKKIKYEEVKL
jgi:hypothetical protein